MTSNQLRLGKFGNAGNVDIESQQLAKGGVRKEDVDQQFKNIFDAFDTDKNNVLTKDEISSMKQQVSSYANHGKDSIFSNKEAEKMIENNSVLKQNNETAENLFQFLQNIESKVKNGNVTDSKVDKDGNAAVTVAQGNKDITKTYSKEDGKNVLETTTVEKDEQGNPKTKTVVKEGSTETYTYINGKECLTKKVENAGTTDEKVTEIKYNENGQKASETVTSKTSEETKELVNGELKTTHKIEDKNDATKRKETTIKYTENGRTETINDYSGTTTVEYIGSNRVKTTKNGKTTDVTTNDDGGKTEVVTNDKNNNTTTTVLTKDNNRLSQKKVVNGKEYNLSYDGQGNITGVVVQYGENIDSICKKFGCTREEFLAANKNVVKTNSKGKQYLPTGATIKIPDKANKLEADNKVFRGRKDAKGALRDEAIARERAKERARQQEMRKQRAAALDKKYRAAGLRDYTHSGEHFKYGNSSYTVIGTMKNRARLMVKNNKTGQVEIASWDHKILKDSYVKITTFYDQGKKVKMRNGKTVVVAGNRGDGHGRLIGVDEQGRQVIISGGKSKTDLSDRVVLNNSYVQASDSYDLIQHSLKTAKNNNEKKAIIAQHRSYSSENYVRCKGQDGRVWYFDLKTGKAVNLTKKEAAAITKELDAAANPYILGFGTDEEKLAKANDAIVDPAVLKEINAHYAKTSHGSYTGFLHSELSDSEVGECQTDWVKNNAVLDQKERDNILYTNMTTFGNNSANRNKALRAVGTRADYDNLNRNLAHHNQKKGYKSHFKGQDAIQTSLYNLTGGDAAQIDAANRALVYGENANGPKDFLSHEEVINIQAQTGAYYLEQGDSHNATRTQDAEVLAAMDRLTTTDGKKIDVSKNANKADLMVAGYGKYSPESMTDATAEEVANEVIKNLNDAHDQLEQLERILKSNQNSKGPGAPTNTNTEREAAKDFSAKAFNLIKNEKVLQLVKKRLGNKYNAYIAYINKWTQVDFSKLQVVSSTSSNLSQEETAARLEEVNKIRQVLNGTESQHLSDVDNEGWKLDLVNTFRETYGEMGETRRSADRQYSMQKSVLKKLELAAKGQLVDANGKKISFEDAVKQYTGKTVAQLQQLNQNYKTSQSYGEMGLDITVGLLTMVIPGVGEAAIGKLITVGGKTYKVLKAVNLAKKEFKVVEVTTKAGKTTKNVAQAGTVLKSLENGAKVATAQYAMDRTNIATSVSGNTLENRGATAKKAQMTGAYAATGTLTGNVTGAVASRFTSTASKVATNIAGVGADLASQAAVDNLYGNASSLNIFNEDGTINTANVLNDVMTASGYLNGLRGHKVPNNTHIDIKPIETPNLDAISKNAKSRSVYIKTQEKFNLIENEVEQKLKTITTEADLNKLKEQVGVIQNRKMFRKLDQKIEARRAELKNTPKPAPKVTPEPNKPVTPKETPVTPKPEKPATPKETPVTPKPEKPAAPKETPVTPKPEKPVTPKETPVAPKPAEPTSSIHSKLEKGHSYELDKNLCLKVGDEVIDFEHLNNNLKQKIESLPEGGSIKIGRKDINPDNMTISREHLLIKKENGKIYIEDTSSYGTTILDKNNAQAYKSIQQLKSQIPAMNTSTYLVNEKKFLDAIGNDYELLNKLVTTKGIDISSYSFTNIMTSANNNNKTILETFLNNPKSIKTRNGFRTSQISQEDLSMLMLFNRNNTNVGELISSPSKVHTFLGNTKKEINNLRQVHAQGFDEHGRLTEVSNSEIADAILYGKTKMDDGHVVAVSARDTVLDDIENLVHGKDYIQHFSKNDNLTTIYAKTQTGDVASINGQMFVNDGEKMVQLSLKEDTFRDLFPPVQRFSMHQGRVGTCYLDTSINILANSRKGRAKLYQMIGEENINGQKRIYTTTANGGGHKEYFNRLTRSEKNLRDNNGLAIIEQGYCMNSRRHALNHAEVTRIMVANAGGSGVEALRGLTGDTAIYIEDPAVMRQRLETVANRDDVFIYAGSNNYGGGDTDVVNLNYNIYQGHAYAVTGYNEISKTVKIANPWHSGIDIEVPIDEFLGDFRTMQIAQI